MQRNRAAQTSSVTKNNKHIAAPVERITSTQQSLAGSTSRRFDEITMQQSLLYNDGTKNSPRTASNISSPAVIGRHAKIAEDIDFVEVPTRKESPAKRIHGSLRSESTSSVTQNNKPERITSTQQSLAGSTSRNYEGITMQQSLWYNDGTRNSPRTSNVSSADVIGRLATKITEDDDIDFVEVPTRKESSAERNRSSGRQSAVELIEATVTPEEFVFSEFPDDHNSLQSASEPLWPSNSPQRSNVFVDTKMVSNPAATLKLLHLTELLRSPSRKPSISPRSTVPDVVVAGPARGWVAKLALGATALYDNNMECSPTVEKDASSPPDAIKYEWMKQMDRTSTPKSPQNPPTPVAPPSLSKRIGDAAQSNRIHVQL